MFLNPSGEDGKEKDEQRFNFTVGTYAIRPFLRQLEEAMLLRDDLSPTPEPKHRRRWKEKLQAWRGRCKLPSAGRRLGFREIEADGEVVGGKGSVEKARIARPKDRELVAGLVWHYRAPAPSVGSGNSSSNGLQKENVEVCCCPSPS